MRSFALILLALSFLVSTSSLSAEEAEQTAPVKSDSPKRPNTTEQHNKAKAEQHSTKPSPLPFNKTDTSQNTQSKPLPSTDGSEAKAIAKWALWGTWVQAGILVATLWLMAFVSIRQLRAYVMPHGADLWDGSMLTPPQPARFNVPGVTMAFKNTGKTPAYNVITWANIGITQPINEDNLVTPPLSRIFDAPLGADSTMPKAIWFHRPLTPHEITDIANGQQAIYLYGRVEYRDAFHIKRHTSFRLYYTGQFPPQPGAIFYFCQRGNTAK